ncbi:MAG: hypothetical protein Q9196_004023 [Gyalolechia fulgens]
MDGDGLDDMVWVTEDGHVSIWSNGQANANPAAQSSWNWIPQNNGQPIVTGINAKREQYHLADIDGDGKADLVIVEMNTGILSAWLNVGANQNVKPSGWVWIPVGTISPAVGDAAGVRFADVTGDGKADLIWLDDGSRMTIYRNDYNPGSRNWWFNKITSTAIDLGAQNRKDMRFADIDGDQKADALWVHPSDGTTVAWLNRDPSKSSGWVRSVSDPNTIDPSHMPTSGDNIMFARITVPYGRADFVMVDARVTLAWKNMCNKYALGSSGKSGSEQPRPAGSTPVTSQPTTVVPSVGESTSKTDNPVQGNSASASSVTMSSRIMTVIPLPVDSTGEPIEPSSTTVDGGLISSQSSGTKSGIESTASAGSSSRGSSNSRSAHNTLAGSSPSSTRTATGLSPSADNATRSGQGTPATGSGERTTSGKAINGQSPSPLSSSRSEQPTTSSSSTPNHQSTSPLSTLQLSKNLPSGSRLEQSTTSRGSNTGLSTSPSSSPRIGESKPSDGANTGPSTSTARPATINTELSITIATPSPSLSSSPRLNQFTSSGRSNTGPSLSTNGPSITDTRPSITSENPSPSISQLGQNETAPTATTTGSGDVYVGSEVLDTLDALVSCLPPCLLIFAPLSLLVPSTIFFPSYTTSLEVAWKTSAVVTLQNGAKSTSTGFDRMVQTTVLRPSPVTTNQIDFWNVRVTPGASSTLCLIDSIQPQPFVVTNNPNPRNEPGVSHPVATRTITPPPYPWDTPNPCPRPVKFTSKASDDEQDEHGNKVVGGGGPRCRSGCG